MKLNKLLQFGILALFASIGSSCGSESDPDPVFPPSDLQEDISIIDDAAQAFMSKYNVPGLSLAISKNEKLVYVKGYGLADKEANEAVSTETLFRIASISKSITGIAMMKLLDNGQVNMDDKVFGEGAILGTTYGTKPYSSHLQAITLRHLLNHTVGVWTSSANDPMFSNPNMTADELMTWTLDTYPVTSTPGNTYAYSNFGYCILGRVIEKISGKTYENFVKEEILNPIGITQMKIGGNTLAQRKTMESKYYGTSTGGPDPYAYQIARMDAHGGWIASPSELLKLLVYVDGFASKSDVLSVSAIQQMTNEPNLAVRSYYAAGWGVNDANNWWHMGSLPGTSSIWVRANNGYSWAIITNTRTGTETNDLDAMMWNILSKNPVFQDIDQF